MATRKAALRIARQYRTCPPPHIRNDPRHSADMENHRRICPYCRTPPEDVSTPWAPLMARLRLVAGSASPQIQPAAPGQLRYLRPDLARWRDGFFYNPPLVLLLRDLSISPRVFKAAQTYHDLLLAGPGDLIVQDSDDPSDGWFIETWNCYAVRADDLGGRVVDSAAPAVLSAAVAMEADPDALPPWAPLPRPIADDQDPRICFRELEGAVGHAFAPEPRLDHLTVRTLLEGLERVAPDAYLEETPETAPAVLAALQFPPDRLGLAAEDGDAPVRFANLVTLKGGALAAVEPLPAHIFDTTRDAGVLTVDGRIADLPVRVKGSRFFACLKSAAGAFHSPAFHEWDEATGSFLVHFELPESEEEGALYMAVAQETGEAADD